MKIGKGSRIALSCKVNVPWRISIGHHTMINEHCYLDGRGGLFIGNNAAVSMQTLILTASHDRRSAHFDYYEKEVRIGDYVWVGSRAIILDGSILNDYCVLGAGSILKGNTEKNSVYIGCPAIKKCERGLDTSSLPDAYKIIDFLK